MSTMSMRHHWVQVEEVKFAGDQAEQSVVQRPFAAVACSRRCAVVVLTAALPAEDAARADEENLVRIIRNAGRSD